MTKTITFNELRRIKDSLPGRKYNNASPMSWDCVETVRNHFGGHNFQEDGVVVSISSPVRTEGWLF